MADSQGRSPYDTGYDPYSDPDSGLYGQNPPDATGGTQAAPSPTNPNPKNLPVVGGGGGTPPDQSGIEGTPSLTNPGGGNGTDMQLLSYLLAQNASNPQAAVDQFNKLKPGSPLAPAYYPNQGKGVIGVAGQSLPYLVAPGTNPGQSDWQFGGVPGGDANGGGGVGSYSALVRPDSVSQPYTPAQWNETYKVPSIDDLLSSPGYQADATSMQRGLERSAAARGSVLSGGFVGRTLPRALGDFTSTAYKNLNDQNFQNYSSRYNQFLNANNMALGARQLNENDYNTDVTNNLNQYLTRYGGYQDLIKNNLSYADLGLRATQSGNPGSAT